MSAPGANSTAFPAASIHFDGWSQTCTARQQWPAFLFGAHHEVTSLLSARAAVPARRWRRRCVQHTWRPRRSWRGEALNCSAASRRSGVRRSIWGAWQIGDRSTGPFVQIGGGGRADVYEASRACSCLHGSANRVRIREGERESMLRAMPGARGTTACTSARTIAERDPM